ncbi:ribonuclease HII [Clostridium sp. P21]|uniref:Ribonuclease HII n=1 Tax=Clostridium muellerianum TaxID=2716538 RepID=A0A7Y0ELH5_9CLOT|nr:ribonuclease HII [Clostridium muellerianum]NMM65674.1 ribonuclease HII [Clostridium muellerianum]
MDILNSDIYGIEEKVFKEISDLKIKDIKFYVDYIKENYIDFDKNRIIQAVQCLNNDSRKNVQLLSQNLSKFIVKQDNELLRVESMYNFDKNFGNYIYVAGVDEVGRGPLAGPIAAGSVVLDLRNKDCRDLIFGIKDSKKLSSANREKLAKIIKNKAISYNIAVINNVEIDERGIAWCNNEVLKRAACGLKVTPDLVLSDGYAVKNLNIENEFVIKGDAKSASIACASIIAKVYRDNLMKEYAKMYPQYGFERNAGYGTEEHIKAIKEYGICKIHRKSFLKNIL